MDMSQFAYALYKIVLTLRNLVPQDTPSFLSLLGRVLTFIVGSLFLLTVVLLNEQKTNVRKINKVTKN